MVIGKAKVVTGDYKSQEQFLLAPDGLKFAFQIFLYYYPPNLTCLNF